MQSTQAAPWLWEKKVIPLLVFSNMGNLLSNISRRSKKVSFQFIECFPFSLERKITAMIKEYILDVESVHLQAPNMSNDDIS